MSKHPIVHVEIPVANRETGSQFYADLFGWKLEHHPEMSYTTFQAEGGPGGGFYSPGDVPEGSEYNSGSNLLVHVLTDDVDASLERAEQLGGSIVSPKMEIPGVGWFGIFADPNGNRLAVFKPMEGQWSGQSAS